MRIDVMYRVIYTNKLGTEIVDFVSKASLKEDRKRQRLSQEELARRAGVSPVTIRNYEKGRTAPNAKTMEKIYTALYGRG